MLFKNETIQIPDRGQTHFDGQNKKQKKPPLLARRCPDIPEGTGEWD